MAKLALAIAAVLLATRVSGTVAGHGRGRAEVGGVPLLQAAARLELRGGGRQESSVRSRPLLCSMLRIGARSLTVVRPFRRAQEDDLRLFLSHQRSVVMAALLLWGRSWGRLHC